MPNPFDLQRFVDAQRGTYDAALREIRLGRKLGHWMWFVFPQIAGLGTSPTAQRYAIVSLDEARAYLAHPTLGPRLREIVSTLQSLPAASAVEVFGPIDAVKLRSCLTLFAEAGGGPLFTAALARWFGWRSDTSTLKLLALGRGPAR